MSDEIRRFRDLGYRRAKIKIGSAPLAQDLKRIDAAARQLDGPGHLAVDAIYAYTATTGIEAADMLAPLRLWWFEDICDPLDFETLAAVARCYTAPIADGEALFSAEEANLLDRHGGLRRDRDILLFDPVHCYGLPGYLQILQKLEDRGWPRSAFWPHGGHLFCLHVVAAVMPGRDGKAGSLIELESWVWRDADLTRGRRPLTPIRDAFLLRPADAFCLRR